MSITQFAMVEELAQLVKDNLQCKHMVLSMEDALLNFLHTHPTTSLDAVLEMEPMDPYTRLLMHRLADIFGFAHISVGEGESRHLVLERCPETSIPSILVSDMLLQDDVPQPTSSPHLLLRKKDAAPVLLTNLPSQHTLEEREAAYLAARQRIFSLDGGEMGEHAKQRPRSVPVVARRMIAHALGQKSHPENPDNSVWFSSPASYCVSFSFVPIIHQTTMSITQFAMVEELAQLVKDNLQCKHMVLSMEDALLNFLHTHPTTSLDAVLEMEPMDPYTRLLMHRLADIFGFAHISVGEGESRHLVLERCPETSIPSILVSDMLLQDDVPQPISSPHLLLRKKDAAPVLLTNSPSQHTLEEREAAYLAARQRIFSLDGGEMGEHAKQRPRSVPVVARRMIAHALGQKSHPENPDNVARSSKGYEVQTKEKDTNPISGLETSEGTSFEPCKCSNSHCRAEGDNHKGGSSSCCQKVSPREPVEKNYISTSGPHNSKGRNALKKEFSKEDQIGAAKRLFSHALGLQSSKGGFLTKSGEAKQLA
ncbi:hypothetical protein Tsubulata_011647 [Turnera subulata]|uniref:R3H domain-containing protein n=1 Tax=Turnera subulata TaxID=218843 RepID=A0A9Q0J493_9ROSI|nr:hypothetical protein Tsubulata_011647 [Turnera subulata]